MSLDGVFGKIIVFALILVAIGFWKYARMQHFAARHASEFQELICEETDDGIVVTGAVGESELLMISETVEQRPVVAIADGAFASCNTIRVVHLPQTLRRIGQDAFRDCQNLFSVKGSEFLETIGPGAFANCKNLTKFAMPENVDQIAETAFEGCASLETNSETSAPGSR